MSDDVLTLRALNLDAELARHPEYGPALVGVDMAPVVRRPQPVRARGRLSSDLDP